MTDIPRIVSADDHVVEPPSVWVDRLSARDREVVHLEDWSGRDEPPGEAG